MYALAHPSNPPRRPRRFSSSTATAAAAHVAECAEYAAPACRRPPHAARRNLGCNMFCCVATLHFVATNMLRYVACSAALQKWCTVRNMCSNLSPHGPSRWCRRAQSAITAAAYIAPCCNMLYCVATCYAGWRNMLCRATRSANRRAQRAHEPIVNAATACAAGGGAHCRRGRRGLRCWHTHKRDANTHAGSVIAQRPRGMRGQHSRPRLHRDWGPPLPHLHRDWGSHVPHLHRDWGLPLPHLHRDWGPPLPHLHRDWVRTDLTGARGHVLARVPLALAAAGPILSE